MKLIRKVLAISSIVLAAAAFTACNSSPNYNTTIATASRGISENETVNDTLTCTFLPDSINRPQHAYLTVGSGASEYSFEIKLNDNGSNTIIYPQRSAGSNSITFYESFSLVISIGTGKDAPFSVEISLGSKKIIASDAAHNVDTPTEARVRIQRTTGANSLDSIEISGGEDQWTINN